MTLLRRVQAISKPIRTRLFSTPTTLHPRRPRTLFALTAATLVGVSSYSLGALYPPSPIEFISPRPAPAPPSDPTTSEARAATAALAAQLDSLPYLAALRASTPDADWYETRPFQNYPEERRVNSLTAGALRGPGKLGLVPLARVRRDESESVIITHVGRGLCGHDGIVHGGLLATLLDETLARTAINNLPEKVGVTAQLTLNYRAPTKADQFIVIKTKLDKAKGRKAFVTGTVEDLNGTVLVEATAMFVQPKYAKFMDTAAIQSVMGKPTPVPEPIHLQGGTDKQAASRI